MGTLYMQRGQSAKQNGISEQCKIDQEYESHMNSLIQNLKNSSILGIEFKQAN